jgi:hypothetical protein
MRINAIRKRYCKPEGKNLWRGSKINLVEFMGNLHVTRSVNCHQRTSSSPVLLARTRPNTTEYKIQNSDEFMV